MAIFSTAGLTLLKEASIWNPEFAWNFPSAAVNARGDVGVVLYRMGGTVRPEARAFIVRAADADRGWPPPRTHSLAASTHAPRADAPGEDPALLLGRLHLAGRVR